MPLTRFGTWLWAVVPLLGLGELLGHYYFSSRPPEPEDWALLETAVNDWHQPGDLLVVAPYWAEPNARAVFGDTLMPLGDVARPDASGYPRAIEIAILGQRAELTSWRQKAERQLGKFQLRLLENPEFLPVRFDFVERLSPENAEAFTRRTAKEHSDEKPCTWNAKAKVSNGALHGHPTFPKRRFECGRGDWHFVGVTVIEDQHYRPRRCIWAHPSDGAETVVRFREVELHDRIQGYGGLSYFLERESKGTPIQMQIFAGDQLLGNYEHRDGEGWKGFEVSTEGLAGERRDVEFRVSSKRAKQREFCFYASVR